MPDHTEADKSNVKLQNAMRKMRREREYQEKIDTLFKYYAGTDVPVERVAAHMGIDTDFAHSQLVRFGRQF